MRRGIGRGFRRGLVVVSIVGGTAPASGDISAVDDLPTVRLHDEVHCALGL